MAATLKAVPIARPARRPGPMPSLQGELRARLKAVLAESFDRFVPARLDDTFRPITSLTSLITRHREHLAKLRLGQAVIGVILDGRKELLVAGRTWLLQPGDCFLLPAGIELDVVNEPDERSGFYRAIVLNLPPALILRAAAAYPDSIGTAKPAAVTAAPLLALTRAAIDSLTHAVQEIAARVPMEETPLARRLVEHRVIEVMLHFADRILLGQAALPGIVDRARLHLYGEPARAWTAARLAVVLNMSEATLRRQLRMAGSGFKALLDEARVNLARRLLPDRSLSIDDIALNCGYAARAKFDQRFKKLTGQTPQGFRRDQV